MHGKYARLFAPFYTADIIVASPLGLRMIVKSDTEKSRETDFLSSVEVVLIDQFDYLMMQNLDHLHTIMDACNLSPFRSRGADFTRVREHFLDNLQKVIYREYMKKYIYIYFGTCYGMLHGIDLI